MKKAEFLEHLNNESNHRIFLFEALKMTKGQVIEFGSGHGSTPFLREYCSQAGREFLSFENYPDWAAQTGSELIAEWKDLPIFTPDVLFIDHAPGERRQIDLYQNRKTAKIIVIHDTEKGQADAGYQVRQHFSKFKWAVELNTPGGGAGAAMVSNYVDISGLIGMKSGGFEITAIQ